MNCECLPCPGRGNDGHGLTHCAECCFGTGVLVDLDCPVHGECSCIVGICREDVLDGCCGQCAEVVATNA